MKLTDAECRKATPKEEALFKAHGNKVYIRVGLFYYLNEECGDELEMPLLPISRNRSD